MCEGFGPETVFEGVESVCEGFGPETVFQGSV